MRFFGSASPADFLLRLRPQWSYAAFRRLIASTVLFSCNAASRPLRRSLRLCEKLFFPLSNTQLPHHPELGEEPGLQAEA